MSDQHASVEDETERALRLGLATASQMADRYARARQGLARQAQHRGEQEARQLKARYRAEGASATARLALVHRPEWWDRATPGDITSMWQLAVQWQDEQPGAATAAETIARQIRDRYDIDVHTAGVGPETVRAAALRFDEEQRGGADRPQRHEGTATAVEAVLRAEQRDAAIAGPADEPQQKTVEHEPEVEGAGVRELEADQYDRQPADGDTATLSVEELRGLSADARARASLHRAEASAIARHGESDVPPPFDSVERREQTELHLRESGLSADAVAVAMRVDVAHARPAAEAAKVRAMSSRGLAARGGTRAVQRTDRGR